ncbi:hypothetical protein RIF29_15734 [Crotalaria pallida]|uniref:Reverse transcriptase zinc-binding domain-containing protein n=1 Tax=Crotalaria pallida TaxID=3830 RepID=A0AAN9FMD7_CROPI
MASSLRCKLGCWPLRYLGIPVCINHRLFSISLQKDAEIANLGYWINGEWVWNHTWRRPLFDWEMVVLIELNCLLENVALKQDIADRWTWKASPDGTYSVKTVYKSIQVQQQEGDNSLLKVIWKANAPLKSKAFGWRILINKIPTKMNLIRRGIELSTDQRLCALCREQDESTNHLFFACKIAYGDSSSGGASIFGTREVDVVEMVDAILRLQGEAPQSCLLLDGGRKTNRIVAVFQDVYMRVIVGDGKGREDERDDGRCVMVTGWVEIGMMIVMG